MAFSNEITGDPIGHGAGMLVFVPEMLENVSDFARQVYNLAIDQQRWVLYLTLDGQEPNHLADARQLATLAALTQGKAVRASALQLPVANLKEVLCELTHPGDLVIWPEERWFAPANLEQSLGITQQVLPGKHIIVTAPSTPWYQSVLFWLIGLLTIAGFAYLEISLDKVIKGTPLTMALIFLFALEIGILYQLNQILG